MNPTPGFPLPADAKLSADDWIIIERGCALLRPFTAYQKFLEGEKYVTGSLVIPAIYDLRQGLHDVIDNYLDIPEDKTLEGVGEEMLSVLNAKWGDGTDICTYKEGPRRQRAGLRRSKS
jgi:hypothetical protein